MLQIKLKLFPNRALTVVFSKLHPIIFTLTNFSLRFCLSYDAEKPVCMLPLRQYELECLENYKITRGVDTGGYKGIYTPQILTTFSCTYIFRRKCFAPNVN